MKMNVGTKVNCSRFYFCTRRNEFQAAVNVLLSEEPDGETPDEKVQRWFGLGG